MAESCSKAKLTVSSKSSMADEKVQITVQGLIPYKDIVMKMETITDNGHLFMSFGRYKADYKGCVDLSRDQSYGGSYNGIDQMGLFWSLKPHQEIAGKYPRYQKLDVTKPMKFSLYLYNIDIISIEDLNQLQSDGKLQEFQLDCCQFERWFMKQGFKVEHKTYEKDGFLGTLFLPPGEGPYPGVIVTFGSYPGLLEFKASLLASHGFAALALAVYGPGVKNNYIENGIVYGDAGYFKTAVDFIVGHPKIISSGVGIISICFSVHIALLMAAYMDHIRCVVCINGFIWNMSILYTLNGKKIEGNDYGWVKKFDEHVRGKKSVNVYDIYPMMSLNELYELKTKGLIPFYNKKDVAFMFIAALDDHSQPAGHYADLFKIMLEDAKHPNFEVHKYVGAGHLIEPPYSPLNRVTNIMAGMPTVWGGSTVAHAIAQEDSWRKQINFLRRNIINHRPKL